MIEPWVYPALTATAVLTGFIDAIAGGGGLIMMPALLFAGVPPIQALATNKLQSMFGTAVALRNYGAPAWSTGATNMLTVLLVFVGATAGVLARPDRSMTRLFSLIIPLLLVAVALYVLVSPRMTRRGRAPAAQRARLRAGRRAIGVYDGFFGPGTGTFFTDQPGRAARLRPDPRHGAHQAAQLHQQRRQRPVLRARREDAVAARPVHGGRRDGRAAGSAATARSASARS